MADTSGSMRVVGQMSGTSADGIDLAEVVTDGHAAAPTGASHYQPYDNDLRAAVLEAGRDASRLPGERLRWRESWPDSLRHLERRLTDATAAALRNFAVRPDLVGYHGQTVHHRPDEGITVQLGDGDHLARSLRLPVVWDFRRADMEAGGQGAPLAPFYHHAAVRHAGQRVSCAVLNLGGVANVSFVTPRIDRPEAPGALLAFDTGPGCALIDAWVEQHGEGRMDEGGAIAARGTAHLDALSALMANPYFKRPPPKSLDRDAFTLEALDGVGLEDGAATLAALTAFAVAGAAGRAEKRPQHWYLCGGGRHNAAITGHLEQMLGKTSLEPVEALGLDGDFIEAQAFAYLARRSVAGLPLSSESTTGCGGAVCGGRISRP